MRHSRFLTAAAGALLVFAPPVTAQAPALAAADAVPPSEIEMIRTATEYYYMHDNPETQVDEAHGFEPHYELHFWLYRDNPSGMFQPFNPSVSCDSHSGAGMGH